MEPIIPFEPIVCSFLPIGDEWIYQVKWDGVRMLVYRDAGQTRLVNRHLHDRTLQYPELLETSLYTNASSFILDGEIIAFNNGHPSFHQVMKRDRLKSTEKINATLHTIPVCLMIFDLLYLNGKWLTKYPLKTRQERIGKWFGQTDHVQITVNFPDGNALFDAIVEQNMEGIVAKNLEKPYRIGGKDGSWQKYKNYKDIIAVVGGVIYKGNQLSSLVLGLYGDDGKLSFIGRVGRGIYKMDEWKIIGQFLTGYFQARCPFNERIEQVKGIDWVTPFFTVKVRYIEWTETGTLRQPVLDSFVERDPAACRVMD